MDVLGREDCDVVSRPRKESQVARKSACFPGWKLEVACGLHLAWPLMLILLSADHRHSECGAVRVKSFL
jgi:hypothetical protein